ncbi:histone H1, early embryonic-like [Stomoxys calcitrans]|uniref:histone H1, early embryonic-like n=1 Tax=Stomoxys calcitrans TaxID=35570 RepID=UPI0027E2477D|nr:histone H1, early embryonic-like [Stomoxys calcitrans]
MANLKTTKRNSSQYSAMTSSINAKRLPTTVEMVKDGLIELHTSKGTSLQKLSSYIAGKYVINLTARRKSLIKKHLNELIESDDIINVSGKGLVGSFKISNIKKFRSKLETTKQPVKRKAFKEEEETGNNSPPKRKARNKVNSELFIKKSPKEEETYTPKRSRSSVFDTPIQVSLSEASTLRISTPAGKRSNYDSTPKRLSLPLKKKRLVDSFSS